MQKRAIIHLMARVTITPRPNIDFDQVTNQLRVTLKLTSYLLRVHTRTLSLARVGLPRTKRSIFFLCHSFFVDRQVIDSFCLSPIEVDIGKF